MTIAAPGPRVDRWRLASQAVVVAVAWLWHIRSTGSVAPPALALIAALVAMTFVYGRAFQHWSRSIVAVDPGAAYQLVVGFLCFNSALFALTLASPLGMAGNLMVLGAIAIGLWLRYRGIARCERLPSAELCSLLCIAFCAIAATAWVHEQQPVMTTAHDGRVFTVWTDVFIHARLISEFAQAHGLGTIENLRLAGGTSPIYHFASYLLPAALNAIAGTTAIDSYVAWHLPFGILLLGTAAYALIAVLVRKPWPALVATIAVVALPDALEQGFGIRLLGFHFMTQVNLGMLYGIACMTLAWILMIEACRSGRWHGVVVAFAFLALCVSYKAHLFLANALILMLYPCLRFAGLRRAQRGLLVLAVLVVFTAVVTLSQRSSSVPTIRVDGSGIVPYLAILYDGMDPGRLKTLFDRLYFGQHLPAIVNATLIGTLIAVTSFGAWLLIVPFVVRRWRRDLGPDTPFFVGLVVVNYLAMSLSLAVDDRRIGAIEELLNRPMAWAYFVLVAFVAAALYERLRMRFDRRGRRSPLLLIPLAVVALLGVQRQAVGLQLAPGWPNLAAYADFNEVPACLVEAASFLRKHAAPGDVVLDSSFDPHFVLTALSERQAFVIAAPFAGETGGISERLTEVRALQSRADPQAFRAYAAARGIHWYVVHPDVGARWEPSFLEPAALRCGDLRVLRFDG